MDSTLRCRIRRRLYNSCDHGSGKESPSLPLTEASVEYFRESFPEEEGLDRLDLAWASTVCKNKAASPCSMVMSMLYAKRLRQRSKVYLQAMSSSDVFFISMMMASKYLYDEGVEEEVFNDDWADNAGKDVAEVNRMEVEFLHEMDWHLYVKHEEFLKALAAVERRLAMQEGLRRGWLTYTEMDVLLDWDPVLALCTQVSGDCVKTLSILTSAYLSSLLSLLGATVVATQLSHPMASATLSLLSLSSSLLTQTTPASLNLPPLDPLFPGRSFLQESLNTSRTPGIEPDAHKEEASFQEVREDSVDCGDDVILPPLAQQTNWRESDEETSPKATRKSASLLFLCIFDSLLSQAQCLFGPQQNADWSHRMFADMLPVPPSDSQHESVKERARGGARCVRCGQLESSNKLTPHSYSHKSPGSFAGDRESGGLNVWPSHSHNRSGQRGHCPYRPAQIHPGQDSLQRSPQPTPPPALTSRVDFGDSVNVNNCDSRLFPERWEDRQPPSHWLANLPVLDLVGLVTCNSVPSAQSVRA